MMPPRSAGSGPTWWPAELTERQRVLLHVQPLFEQRVNDSKQPDDARHYDSLALALHVFELVLEASGLDDAVTAARVREALAPALMAMDQAAGIPPDPNRHDRVIERVLGTLRNDANGRRPFQCQYTVFTLDGAAEARLLEFHLLRDAHHPDGEVVLRATTEGANLYLRALALDLESQQAAAEAIVELQLRRGRFQDAADVARQARQQSIRYGEALRAALEQTRRDLSRVDWQTEMPVLLEDAHVHLEGRLEVEGRLLEAADVRLEALEPGSEAAQQVARVRRLLEDCRHRHQDLHGVVLRARQTFLAEQARQTFVPRLLVPCPDVTREILEPVLQGLTRDVLALCDRALTLLIPPIVPTVLWVPELVEWQLQSRRTNDTTGTVDPTRDLIQVADDPRYFPPDVQAAGEELLASIQAPLPLSLLLARSVTARAARPVRDYLVLRSLQAVAPEPVRPEDDLLPALYLRATPHGTLNTPEFVGDDLLLAPFGGVPSRLGPGLPGGPS